MPLRYHILPILLMFAACLCAAESDNQTTQIVAVDSANYRMRDDFVTATLLVAEPSDVLYSTLGHIVIRLQCPMYGLDYCFSYESENVSHKVFSFLAGKLQMGMFAIQTEEYLGDLENKRRGVREFTLNLTPAQKQRLWRFCDEKVAEGANLKYDFVNGGCALSCFSLLMETVNADSVVFTQWPRNVINHTWREIVASRMPVGTEWQWFVMMLLVGNEVDSVRSPYRNMIVPEDVVYTLQYAIYNGMPILSSNFRWLVPYTDNTHRFWLTPQLLGVLLLILEIVVSMLFLIYKNVQIWRYLSASVDVIVLCICGILGGLLTYLVVFSQLPCTHWNWLFIPFNILPIIAWHWRRYWCLPVAVVLLIWLVAMVAYPHLLVDVSMIYLVFAYVIILLKSVFYEK